MNESLTYAEALKELTKIIQTMEQAEVDPDQLLKMVKRASQLLEFCQRKLYDIEKEVNHTIEELKKQTPPPSGGEEEEN